MPSQWSSPIPCRRGARLDVAKVEHGNLEHVVFRFENVIHDGEVGVETIQTRHHVGGQA